MKFETDFEIGQEVFWYDFPGDVPADFMHKGRLQSITIFGDSVSCEIKENTSKLTYVNILDLFKSSKDCWKSVYENHIVELENRLNSYKDSLRKINESDSEEIDLNYLEKSNSCKKNVDKATIHFVINTAKDKNDDDIKSEISSILYECGFKYVTITMPQSNYGIKNLDCYGEIDLILRSKEITADVIKNTLKFWDENIKIDTWELK